MKLFVYVLSSLVFAPMAFADVPVACSAIGKPSLFLYTPELNGPGRIELRANNGLVNTWSAVHTEVSATLVTLAGQERRSPLGMTPGLVSIRATWNPVHKMYIGKATTRAATNSVSRIPDTHFDVLCKTR